MRKLCADKSRYEEDATFVDVPTPAVKDAGSVDAAKEEKEEDEGTEGDERTGP